MLTRRGFLVGAASVTAAGAAGVIAVERNWLPGRVPLGTAIGRCDLPTTTPTGPPGELLDADFNSAYRKRSVHWTVALPPNHSARGLHVALVLHGRGDHARTAFDDLGLHRFLAAQVRTGAAPFALAAVDGGERYWHPRRDGDDPLGMIVHELLPRLHDLGLSTDRIGVLGWSMGGYGALLLARESAAGRVAGSQVIAAAAASPALFPDYEGASHGAFDDAADFARWGDLVGHPGVSPKTHLWVGCGDTDAFAGPTDQYRSAVEPTPEGAISQGCHDPTYWRSQAGQQLAFIGSQLNA